MGDVVAVDGCLAFTDVIVPAASCNTLSILLVRYGTAQGGSLLGGFGGVGAQEGHLSALHHRAN